MRKLFGLIIILLSASCASPIGIYPVNHHSEEPRDLGAKVVDEDGVRFLYSSTESESVSVALKPFNDVVESRDPITFKIVFMTSVDSGVSVSIDDIEAKLSTNTGYDESLKIFTYDELDALLRQSSGWKTFWTIMLAGARGGLDSVNRTDNSDAIQRDARRMHESNNMDLRDKQGNLLSNYLRTSIIGSEAKSFEFVCDGVPLLREGHVAMLSFTVHVRGRDHIFTYRLMAIKDK
mgnify:CR=1 FL=1